MSKTAADERYDHLTTLIGEALGDDAHLLMELDEVVGERLSEAQLNTVRHVAQMWQKAAAGQVEVSMLPDEDYTYIDCPAGA